MMKRMLFSLGKRKRLHIRVAGVIACFAVAYWFFSSRQLFMAPTSYIIEDRDGNLMSASIATDGQWRFPANDEVPEKFVQCITTFEDKRFFQHPGIDLIAVARSVQANLDGNRNVQGASTITMQIARLASDHRSRNIWNKICETSLAVWLEMRYSKKKLMSLYAANAPFGSNVVGLDAAAWRYFGRNASKLSWGEMAALAVLPNAPSLVHPGKNRETLKQKRNRLLDNLTKAGFLDEQDCELAKLEPLPDKPLRLPQDAPHLLQRFKKEKPAGVSTLAKTTIDGNLQRRVTEILKQHHHTLKGNGINNICALVLDVETGNTEAYAGNISGSTDPEMESDVDVITSLRSPGSTLKPLLYAGMLSEGSLLPNALVPDVPTEIAGFAPENFDLGYDGAVPANKALSRSLNIPAIRLLQQYKYQRFYELLRNLGIKTLKRPAGHYGLSLVLGGCEITMWDLAGVYASLARTLILQEKNRGISCPTDLHPARYLAQQHEGGPAESSVVLDPTSIYFTFQAMQEVMRPGEEGLWQQFESSQKIAWKTGTSFGFRDGWAIGVTRRNVVAVWVGNTDGEGRAGLVGINTAAPVMFEIFRLLPTVTWFNRPAFNYVFINVCRKTGFRANIDCRDTESLLMPPNGMRSPLCPYHKLIQLDPSGNFRVNDDCASPSNMRMESWFILPPAMEYYYRLRNHDYKPYPAFMPGCATSEAGRQMELIYPGPDARIYVPLEITGEKGMTVFSATHRKPGVKIFWSVDDGFAGVTESPHRLALQPAAGKHVLTLTDSDGNIVTRNFEILSK